MKLLFLCTLLLSGCAATSFPLPPLQTQPVEAQFGLRFTHGGTSLPLQGAVQVLGNEGSLGIIFPHGRTVGVCRYQGEGMTCVPAQGARTGTRFMLQQIGLAVYRILPALTAESPQDLAEGDWVVHWQNTDAGRKAAYQDLASKVTMEMYFSTAMPGVPR